MRFRTHKRNSRLRHHTNEVADWSYPAGDESATPQKEDYLGNTDTNPGGAAVEEVKSDNGGADGNKGPHEMHGEHVPPYSMELQGSPGLARQELPIRRGSV